MTYPTPTVRMFPEAVLSEVLAARWRVGTKLGFTLYAITAVNPEACLFLGAVDDAQLAAYIVELHNNMLAKLAEGDA